MLVLRGPQFAAFRVPHPDGLTETDSDLARMLRIVGDDPPGAAVATITDAAERDALFMSLATTLTRATYHQRRFEEVVRLLATRRLQVGGTVSADTCSKYAPFEAAAMLTAARTTIDEVLYISARRSGVSAKDAVKWEANAATTCDLAKVPQYNVPEVLVLRGRLAWYNELNEYRNVLVHRGWRESLGGFFPPDVTIQEASDSYRNTMLVPDRSSLARSHRAHKWTYGDSARLEELIERAATGLAAFLRDVATSCWGGALPPPGSAPKDKLPNIFVTAPHAALVGAGSIFSPIFSSETTARDFHKVAYKGDPQLDLFPVLPTMLDDGTSQPAPGYWLSLPSGRHLSEALGGHLKPSSALVLVLDAVQANGAILGKELLRVPCADLIASGDAACLTKVPMEMVARAERLLLWRRRP